MSSALIWTGDNQCKDLLVVFARGSGQNNSLILDDTHNATYETIYSDAGVNKDENQTAEFFRDFSNRVGSSTSVQYVSLHDFSGKYNNYGYAAVDAITGMKSAPKHRKDVANRYYESVKDGSEELAWYLEDQMTSCPLQRVVVGGYSQGAETVADGIELLQSAFRARISYLALYGDPQFNPLQSLVPPILGSWARGDAVATHGLLGSRSQYLPDGITSMGSWCTANDYVCDAGPIYNKTLSEVAPLVFNYSPHSSEYQSHWIPQSMPEIIKAVKNSLPNVTNGAGTNVFINKNDKLWQLDLAVVVDVDQSMKKSLQTIEGNVSGLTGELLGSYRDSRVAVVSYDTPSLPNSYSRVESPFTSDHTTISDALHSLPINSQSQEERQLYSGLMTAMNELSWRHGAQKKIIVITNGGAANPSADGYTENQVTQRAYELDPVVLNVANTSCDDAAGTCDWDSYDQLQSLVDATNGANEMVNISSGDMSGFTNLLSNMEMQPVAAITGDTTGYVNVPLNLSGNNSYDPNGTIIEYRWDCDSDGTWDTISADPNTTCTYSAPYDGLVTLRVTPEDGTFGLATLPVHVTGGAPPVAVVPETPVITHTYTASSVKLTWSNGYAADTYIRVADSDDNILGYAPASATAIHLSGIGSEVPELHISACNDDGCNNPTIISLDQESLETLIASDDTTSFFVDNPAQLNTGISQQSASQSPATTVQPVFLLTSFAASIENTGRPKTFSSAFGAPPNGAGSTQKTYHNNHAVFLKITLMLGIACILAATYYALLRHKQAKQTST